MIPSYSESKFVTIFYKADYLRDVLNQNDENERSM